jgi:hypothetical protein
MNQLPEKVIGSPPSAVFQLSVGARTVKHFRLVLI